ncbi:2-phosphosulfolactate phosphatase [Glaciibacter superstes]|uniref:2-phosphosulfolactate phosphatase n=1 Tax=Glaciibacter superstes TaxID=501023 RepID=UPI0003B75EA1|nr:2-phosphosulfolactate phosphatase [Glaciibacter superstes]
MNDTQPQQFYQVRFDWALPGFQALAAQSDVVVIADALPAPSVPSRPESARPAPTPLGAHRVITASLNNRTAVAEWVLGRQGEKSDRFSVAVIAAGDVRPDGTSRFAVEDLLLAGAVIDALSTLGIDHCSPEAAAASASFVGLRQARKHLLLASESGQALAASGRRDEVHAAAVLDNSSDIALITEFAFRV